MGLAKDLNYDEKSKTPMEYEDVFDSKDPSGTVKLIEQRTRYALRRESKWRELAKEDYKFALGEQWTEEEKQLLKEQNRPAMTFNKIEPMIDLIGGWERENSLRIRVTPEGGEDTLFSEIGDHLMKAIDKWTKLNFKIDHQFDDGIISGKGWLEMSISYDDDVVNGDLIFRNCSIYQILKDPDGKEYDRSDWDYIIKLTKLSKSKLKKMYPEKASVIDGITEDNIGYIGLNDTMKEGDADNYHLGKTDMEISDESTILEEGDSAKLLLKECWYRKYVTKFFVFNVKLNKLERFDSKEEAEKRREEILAEAKRQHEMALQGYEAIKQTAMATQMMSGQVNPNAMPTPPVEEEIDVKIIKRPVSEMWLCATAAGELLQEPVRSPFAPVYEDFPFFNYFAKWYVSAENEETAIKGITRNAKDPQKEINKSKSQFLHIINTSANSGWVGDRDALLDTEWEDLKKMGAAPGIIIRKKPGSQLERISPAGVSQAHLIRKEDASQDIKDVTGVNPDAMAMQDKTTSGRAIGLRIKQALTILSKYFRNFRFTKEMIGEAIWSVVPEVFDVHSIKKVLGEQFMQVNQIDESYLKAFLAQIADGRYNVNITESDNSSTLRQETFEQLTELASNGYPIPPDVLIEFSSIPNSKEVIDKIKQYMAAQQEAEASKKK